MCNRSIITLAVERIKKIPSSDSSIEDVTTSFRLFLSFPNLFFGRRKGFNQWVISHFQRSLTTDLQLIGFFKSDQYLIPDFDLKE